MTISTEPDTARPDSAHIRYVTREVAEWLQRECTARVAQLATVDVEGRKAAGPDGVARKRALRHFVDEIDACSG